MPNFRRTSYFLNVDKIREAVKQEITVRGATQSQIAEETGILVTGLSRFLLDRQTLQGDSLISLIKWMGLDVNRFISRRGRIASHKDNYEQRQLRKALAFLNSQGVELQQGESPVDALMELVAKAKADG